MAERVLGTVNYWSVQLQRPEKWLRGVMADVEEDGLRGESQKQYFLATVMAAVAAVTAGDAATDDHLELDQQRARLAKEQADKLEMENARSRGELAYLPDVEKAWAQLLTAFRARLLGAGSKLAPRANPENPSVAKDVIDQELQQILLDLSFGKEVTNEEPDTNAGANKDQADASPDAGRAAYGDPPAGSTCSERSTTTEAGGKTRKRRPSQ